MCNVLQTDRKRRNAFEEQAITALKAKAESDPVAAALVCVMEEMRGVGDHVIDLEKRLGKVASEVNATRQSLVGIQTLDGHFKDMLGGRSAIDKLTDFSKSGKVQAATLLLVALSFFCVAAAFATLAGFNVVEFTKTAKTEVQHVE